MLPHWPGHDPGEHGELVDPLVLRGPRVPKHPVFPDWAPGVSVTHVTDVTRVLAVAIRGVLGSTRPCRLMERPHLVPDLGPGAGFGSVIIKIIRIFPDLTIAACNGRRGAELRVEVDIPAAVLKHKGVHRSLSDLVIDGVLEPVIITLGLKCGHVVIVYMCTVSASPDTSPTRSLGRVCSPARSCWGSGKPDRDGLITEAL